MMIGNKRLGTMKTKTQYFLALTFITLLSGCGSASVKTDTTHGSVVKQKTDRATNRATNRVENRVDRKTDRAVDRAVDRVFKKIF